MLRRWFPRIASQFVAFAVLVLVTACGQGPMVPAPVESPQSRLPRPQQAAPVAPVTGAPLAAPGGSKVALLLPLSGPNARLGKAMLNAAQLALFTMGSEGLTLVPRDTGGTAEGAAKAAQSAVNDGAQLILGPLLAAEVASVKPIAMNANINLIGFSTATQLAGGNAFLMGFLPHDEAVREVSYAREKGLSQFAALLPNSPYGHLMEAALRDGVAASGGQIGKIEYFDPRGADTSGAVQRLIGAPTGGAGIGTAPPPAPKFDALLLPEGGSQLKQLAGQIKAAGISTTQVRLLGSGLWDDATVAGDPALYGGWFATSPPDARHDFENRYQAAYHQAPPRLASLAFDGAALAAVLAKAGGDHPFSRDAILNPSGFTGVDGLFRFTSAGLVQRGLAVLEVEPQGNVVVSPAPQSFAGPGL
ncbi:MAG TPA: penicillin-binding protein activator [Stellaceae bacterium]|nr:penicillin-binding protein activator [Stellaceae bacterium]